MLNSKIGLKSNQEKKLLSQIIEDWLPILVLIIIYSNVRRYVNINREVNLQTIYNLEHFFFGWMTNSEVPAFAFVESYNPVLVVFSTLAYSLHFVIPTMVAIQIGYRNPDRETFAKLRFSILIVTILALVIFIVFPVAPPWYIYLYGFLAPHQYSGTTETAAGLLKFDQIFNIKFYGVLYDSTPPAPFAAFPSLHASYSFLTALVLVQAYKSKNKKIYLMYLYPLSVWFATVFLNHHYIIDLLGGALFSLLSYKIGSMIVSKRYAGIHQDLEIKQEDTIQIKRVISDNQDVLIEIENI